MIKEVIFDIDDTLYDYEKGHAAGIRQMREYAEQELGVSPARAGIPEAARGYQKAPGYG
ncbi:MAG: hypothetical protein V8Q27_04230 [Eubacteriales bacterium]